MDDLKRVIIESLAAFDKEKTMTQYEMARLNINKRSHLKTSKDSQISQESRSQGNDLFVQRNHDFTMHFKILYFYNTSIAFAPSGSEQLAAAYGNRSAILRHIGKYVESICEAEKALKITKLTLLRVKLLCRQADAYTALGSSENRNCLEKAKFLLSKSEDSEKTKLLMSEMIRKAQSIIDADKLDKPKESKRLIQASKMASDVEKEDLWSSLKLEYSDKYGRYLVANRDYEAGEIILVEKPWYNHLNEGMLFWYCSYCFEYLWTVVPCDHCSWRLYCSEECRDKAWNEHHEIDCSVLVQMREIGSLQECSIQAFVMSVFCKALKEAGDIKQLRNEIQSVDNCKDERSKGFSSDGKFEGFKSIYSLPLRKITEKSTFEAYRKSSTIAVLGLARYSDIFGKNYSFNETRKLMKNEGAVFAGALILKFCLVINSRVTNILLTDPTDLNGTIPRTLSNNPYVCSVLKSLGFLNLIECAPNAKVCLCNGNRHLMYALEPIKKGTPLITSMSSIYQDIPKPRRQVIYKNFHNRPCECRACTEDWLEKIAQKKTPEESGRFSDNVVIDLIEEMQSIEKEAYSKKFKLNHPDIKLLNRAKNLVIDCWNDFSMPSYLTKRSVGIMMHVFDSFFSPLVFDPETTGVCKN